MKRDYPATQRNRQPILEVLRQELPAEGLVLEVGSGSGQHAAFFAAALPALRWQPTDHTADTLASIAAWQRETAAPNLAPPLPLDLLAGPWPVAHADAVFCANVIHISPFACTEALLAGAGAVLPAGGPLVLYGPFRRGGAHTAPSNEAFDASLRARDPSWGVRDLDVVTDLADRAGLERAAVHAMPANNLTVVFRRR